MTFEWSETLATGVNAIDNQHKEIFNRFNRLFSACKEGKGKDEVLDLLKFLEDYVKEHFAAEERLQVRHSYPEYAAHKAQHAKFMTDVARLTGELKAEGATLPLVVMTNQTLTSWLVQHIRKTDMDFASYLRENGGA